MFSTKLQITTKKQCSSQRRSFRSFCLNRLENGFDFSRFVSKPNESKFLMKIKSSNIWRFGLSISSRFLSHWLSTWKIIATKVFNNVRLFLLFRRTCSKRSVDNVPEDGGKEFHFDSFLLKKNCLSVLRSTFSKTDDELTQTIRTRWAKMIRQKLLTSPFFRFSFFAKKNSKENDQHILYKFHAKARRNLCVILRFSQKNQFHSSKAIDDKR